MYSNDKSKRNFFCLLKHDAAIGILRPILKWLPVILIFAASGGYLLAMVEASAESGTVSSKATLGDMLAYVFQGKTPYNPEDKESFSIPFGYLLPNLYLAYLIGNYPVKDLLGTGQQILLRTQTRARWWLSKCAWCAGTVLAFYLVGYAVMLVLTAAGGELSLRLTPELGNLHGMYTEDPSSMAWLPSAFVLPIATSLALSMLQLGLMMLIKPVGAYIAVAVIVSASAYFYTPLLIGNYSMLLRSVHFMPGGLGFWLPLMADIAITLISAAAGLLAFRRYDILDKA